MNENETKKSDDLNDDENPDVFNLHERDANALDEKTMLSLQFSNDVLDGAPICGVLHE